jgi:hypothetical protein
VKRFRRRAPKLPRRRQRRPYGPASTTHKNVRRLAMASMMNSILDAVRAVQHHVDDALTAGLAEAKAAVREGRDLPILDLSKYDE